MKYILLGLILISNISFAGKSLPPAYNVVSDVESSTVPKGMCLIKGIAYNYGTPIFNGKVSTLNGNYHTQTDSSGAFELLISSKDTAIFFFKSQYSEVVIWNYNFKSGHEVVINFNPGANVYQLEVDKPVIYLYSETDLRVNLNLDFKGELTFTYPEYIDGWQAQVGPSGISVNEKTYPYLFWEGTISSLEYDKVDKVRSGSMIQSNEVVTFLESSLEQMGFNETEKTDFITFWGPRIVAHNFSFVQFVIDEDYESQIASLNIEPKPDANRRVYMKFTGYEIDPQIESVPQTFESFQRTGFTLLEWGGTEIGQNKINL